MCIGGDLRAPRLFTTDVFAVLLGWVALTLGGETFDVGGGGGGGLAAAAGCFGILIVKRWSST